MFDNANETLAILHKFRSALFAIILMLLLLTGCTSRSRYTTMRTSLDSINMLNRTDQPFTVADVQPYVDYFDRHGTANDRLLAHYLQGRAYHEHGEAPMALKCYQQAADCVDTTAADCDYAQLCRVYSQMDALLFQQGLYQEELLEIEQAIKYAKLGKDTLAFLFSYEQKAKVFEQLKMKDSFILVCEQAAALYTKHHYPAYAAIVLGRTIKPLIDDGNYEKANQYLENYESESGLFDNHHDILQGREIFYYCKGLLFLSYNQTDSAEFYFRKELRDGKDFNNQNAGALGLAQVYKMKNIPDSVARYYQYAYAMNDSMYCQRTTEKIANMRGMYNYTRHQEFAQEESARAYQTSIRFWISISILLMVCIFSSWLYIAKKKVNEILERTVSELAELKIEQKILEQDKIINQQRITENQKYIQKLEKKLGRYGSIIFIGPKKAENDLKLSSNYHVIQGLAVQGKKLTEKEWFIIDKMVNEYFPGCYDYIHSRIPINTLQYKICLLLRLHFLNKEISGMLGFTPAYISKLSSIIYKDLFDKEGSSKELATALCEIF